MAQCSAFKRSGERCTLPANGQQGLCWAHDPRNAEKRRRGASRGGKGKASKVSKDLHTLLEDLTQQVIAGELETSRGAVANQLITTRIKLFEFERRLKETEELERRVEELSEAMEQQEARRRGA